MMYRMLARLVVAIHSAYAIFVAFGSLLVLRWPVVIWLHGAAVFWAFVTLVFDTGCPLTPWEKTLWRKGGVVPYPEGFIQHHFLRTSLSEKQSRRIHVGLGTLALALNIVVYMVYFTRR